MPIRFRMAPTAFGTFLLAVLGFLGPLLAQFSWYFNSKTS
jgi:hypothetical protein